MAIPPKTERRTNACTQFDGTEVFTKKKRSLSGDSPKFLRFWNNSSTDYSKPIDIHRFLYDPPFVHPNDIDESSFRNAGPRASTSTFTAYHAIRPETELFHSHIPRTAVQTNDRPLSSYSEKLPNALQSCKGLPGCLIPGANPRRPRTNSVWAQEQARSLLADTSTEKHGQTSTAPRHYGDPAIPYQPSLPPLRVGTPVEFPDFSTFGR
jgi:hypothetical protein